MPNIDERLSPFTYSAIGLVAGVFAGFFGVGGGIIVIPLLLLFFPVDQRQASITSLVAIIPTSLVARFVGAPHVEHRHRSVDFHCGSFQRCDSGVARTA